MYRIQEADAIRFGKGIRFEFVNPAEPEILRPIAHSSAAFYYLDKPEGQEPDILPAKDLLCWYCIKNADHQSIP